MRIRAGALAIALVGSAPGAPVLADAPPSAWVRNPARAEQHWLLQCQGCHRRDGAGDGLTVPPIAGLIGRFLSVGGEPSGRDYLVRVPGVASSPLNDEDTAELLNWMMWKYDPAHVPKDYKPYTKEEVARLRSRPIRSDLANTRIRLIRQF